MAENDYERGGRSLERLQRAVDQHVPGTLISVTRTELERLINRQREQFSEKPDMVNHPPHYADRKYEVIDVIEDTLTPEEFRGFLKGNALKYLLREGRKKGTRDIDKAGWYRQKLQEFGK